jgi:hypothetical protein
MLRHFIAVLLLSLCFPLAVSAASLVAKVDVSSQTMTVIRYGEVIHRWPVSTAGKANIRHAERIHPKACRDTINPVSIIMRRCLILFSFGVITQCTGQTKHPS